MLLHAVKLHHIVHVDIYGTIAPLTDVKPIFDINFKLIGFNAAIVIAVNFEFSAGVIGGSVNRSRQLKNTLQIKQKRRCREDVLRDFDLIRAQRGRLPVMSIRYASRDPFPRITAFTFMENQGSERGGQIEIYKRVSQACRVQISAFHF